MKRSRFIRNIKLERSIVPGIGQRWFYNETDEKVKERMIKKGRNLVECEMILKILQAQREFGDVIIGENDENWIIMRNPLNPNQRARARKIPKKVIKNSWRYGNDEDISSLDLNRLIYERLYWREAA